MTTQLIRAGAPTQKVFWFDAVRPEDKGEFESIGARGCFMSHLGVLKKSQNEGFRSVLILEDDCDFVRDFPERDALLGNHLASVEWDIFYGGGVADQAISGSHQVFSVPANAGIQQTHCIAITDNAISKLVRYLSAQLERPAGDPRGGPMHVDGSYSWARRELGLATMMARPEICHQRSSASDVFQGNWWDKSNTLRPVANVLRRLKRAAKSYG